MTEPKTIRDKFVVHDESDYMSSKIGIVVNKRLKKVIKVMGLGSVAYIPDIENQQKMLALVDVGIKFVRDKIDEYSTMIENEYNLMDYQVLEKLPLMTLSAPKGIK